MMSSTSTVQDLSEENGKLRGRLEKCKADKNFVWTLWKHLQVDNPDMTRVVDLIVTREKEKAVQREMQVGTLLTAKDRKIEELTEVLSKKESALCEVAEQWQLSQRALEEREQELTQATHALTAVEEERAVLQERCKEESTSVVKDMQCHLEEKEREKREVVERCQCQLEESEKGRREAVEKLRQKATRLEEVQALLSEIEETARECSQSSVKCKNLDADLRVKTEQLKKTNETLKKRNKEVKKLRETVSSLQSSMNSWVSHTSVQAAGMQHLQERLGEAKAVDAGREERVRHLEEELVRREREAQRASEFYQGQVMEFELQIQHLQEDIARFQSSPPSRSSPTLSTTQLPPHVAVTKGEGGGEEYHLKEHLEAAEAELFGLKSVLQAKDEEMAELKGAHERRLERMRTLQAEHKLVLQQLKTFEQDGSTSPPPPHGPPSSQLQQEDSSAVWNQLHTYKKECDQLKQTNISLSEECDSLRASVVQHKALLQERTLLPERMVKGADQGHDELLQKFALIANLELDGVADSSSKLHTRCPSARAPSHTPHPSHSGKLVLRLQQERTHLQKQLRESHQVKDSLQSQLDTAKRDLLQERRRRAMRERVLVNSGKTSKDASTNTISRMEQSHDRSHDQSHGGVGLKHFSATAAQTDSSMTTQTTPSSSSASVQTETVYPDNQAETVSVCVQTEAVQLCSSAEECHLGDSQLSLRGRRMRGEGESHKRSLSEGTSLVQRRRGGEHGVSFQEESRSALSASQSVPGLSQRPPSHLCQHKSGAEEKEEAGRVIRMRAEVKTLKERTKDLEKQLSRCVAGKQALTHSLGVEKMAHIKTVEEIKELRGQLGRSRAQNDSLSKEVSQLREQYSEQRTKCELLEQLRSREVGEGAERITRLTADKRKLEERLKLHAQKVESLAQTAKTADTAALQKTTECRELESRVSRLERDVKQKRQLIESLKEKESSQQQLLEECQGKMEALLAEMHSLSSSNEQYRHRSQNLRKQLSEEKQAKKQVRSEMDKCNQELQSTLQDLSRCQTQLKEEATSSSRTLAKLRGAEEELQEALHRLGALTSEEGHLRRILEEHQTFTVSLLSEIHLCLVSQQRRGSKRKDHSIRDRARHIARNALNLSDNELDEFLDEASGTLGSKEVSLVQQHLTALWESSQQHYFGEGDREMDLSALMLELFNPLLRQLALS